MKRPCILVPVGTRPEIIKMADVIRDLRDREAVDTCVVFTGQHTDLMDEAAAALEVHADFHVAALPDGRGLPDLLATIIKGLGECEQARAATCFVVQGDTVSCLAGAVVSELLAIPLVHIEAGVRSQMRDDPFPEETIRRMISPISELHICFSQHARSNLLAEGISPETIVVAPHPLRDRVAGLNGHSAKVDVPRALVTLHRRERRTVRAEAVASLVASLREMHSPLEVTFVRHPGMTAEVPWLGERLAEQGVTVLDSQPPDSFLEQVAATSVVITDSAGVAEEAQLLGTPLVVFRRSGEIRLDGATTGPTCVTESLDTALAFAARALAEPRLNGRVPEAAAQSAGYVIGSRIEEFAREQLG